MVDYDEMARDTVKHGNPLGVLEQSDLEGKDYEKIHALIGALVDEITRLEDAIRAISERA